MGFVAFRVRIWQRPRSPSVSVCLPPPWPSRRASVWPRWSLWSSSVAYSFDPRFQWYQIVYKGSCYCQAAIMQLGNLPSGGGGNPQMAHLQPPGPAPPREDPNYQTWYWYYMDYYYPEKVRK